MSLEPDENARFEARVLVKKIAAITGEPRDIVMLRALEERLQRLTAPISAKERAQKILTILDTSLWRNMSASILDASPSRKSEDEILGYGPEGV